MQEVRSLRETLTSDWFARLDLLLVIASGVAWMFFPDYAGASPLLLLLLPWVLRLVGGQFPFRRTKLDWLMLIFLVTTWVGYWASYDKSAALNKAWLITASVFLYYALSAQPEQNITWITSGLFMIGVGVSVYFFITYDFIETSLKIEVFNRFGVWWTGIRPTLPLPPIHPNYVSGVAVLTGMFGFYPLQKPSRGKLVRLVILAGFFVILLALVMATSRGVWMALASAAGIWLLWRLVKLNGINLRLGKEAFFPILVLVYLCGVVAVLYAGPARLPSDFAGSSDFGTGSRAELFVRSLNFLGDYPITGGGLDSFPGLYSQYMLGIPYFYVINSHNLFLDVFIEQGMFGGAAFSLLYVFCIWQVSRAVTLEMNFFRWLVLCALAVAVVHGMVDDYLYNGKGAFLSVFLAGVSMIAARNGQEAGTDIRWWNIGKTGQRLVYLLLVALVVLAGINYKRVCAMWYANLGAVQLAQVELAGFPETGWAGPAIVTRLGQADASLHTALEFDPRNRTANHRLGLISMMRRDFSSAVFYLTLAHDDAPNHRGILKSLGFGYAWLGETDRAVSFLKDVPEAKNELDAYYSWWQGQGRDDLSKSALHLRPVLEILPSQP
jgi:putative inorganic carbon (HCO3(-)) transporter